MQSERWDETWHRLLEWTNSSGQGERLAGQILLAEEFSSLDPSHPLGGTDGGKDAICRRGDELWVMAAYFPRGQQSFHDIKAKFEHDLKAATTLKPHGFVFVTNQELRLAERRELLSLTDLKSEIYHLERVTAILDAPPMHPIRKQFLGIDIAAPAGAGGAAGNAEVYGNRSAAIGGQGGAGGVGDGGVGGDAIVRGDFSFALGGHGGNAATPDGRGGRAALGPIEWMNGPTSEWKYGRGGIGGNQPEYDRRLEILKGIRQEYASSFPDEVQFILAGVETVPIHWVNKRLEELGESWQVGLAAGGYVMPAL